MSHSVKPFALKDEPALIERLLPVQKLSAEAFKEQMAGAGKTLTTLGNPIAKGQRGEGVLGTTGKLKGKI